MDDRCTVIRDGLGRRVSRRLVLGASGLLVGLPVRQTAARHRHRTGRMRRGRTPQVGAAAQPSVETFHDAGAFEIGPCPSGVTLVETFMGDVRVTTFFDQAGDPVRAQVHIDFVGVVTNSTTGQTVKDPGRITRTIDLTTGARSNAGLYFSTIVPGVGVVFHDAGHLMYDTAGNLSFEAGPHDVLHGDYVALFCAALGA
jgi:hypothetical protein